MAMHSGDFTSKYHPAIESYNKAKHFCAQGEADAALLYVRKALEVFISELCSRCGIETTRDNREITLEEMIKRLSESAVISEEQASKIHRVRMLGNKGVHAGDRQASLDDARQAIEELKAVIAFLPKQDDDAWLEGIAKKNNVPERNPDYYGNRSRYTGMWWRCYSREELLVIPEYVELHRKAERGDISAMLDLAAGFLPKDSKKIVWSNNRLVCMPKYYPRGSDIGFYNEDAYDARYYYWITRACYTASEAAGDNFELSAFPQKYMATAFLEGAKFVLMLGTYECKNYISGVVSSPQGQTAMYDSPYEVAKRINGESADKYCLGVDRWLFLLLELANVSEAADIIAPIHEENTRERILYLWYCMGYFVELCRGEGETLVVGKDILAIEPADEGKPVTLDMLQRYSKDPICEKYYLWVVNKTPTLHKEIASQEKTQKYLDTVRNLMNRVPILKQGIRTAVVWHRKLVDSVALAVIFTVLHCFALEIKFVLVLNAAISFGRFLITAPFALLVSLISDWIWVSTGNKDDYSHNRFVWRMMKGGKFLNLFVNIGMIGMMLTSEINVLTIFWSGFLVAMLVLRTWCMKEDVVAIASEETAARERNARNGN